LKHKVNNIKAWKVTSAQGISAPPQQTQGNPLPPPTQSSGPIDTSNVPAGKEPDKADDYVDDLPF